MIEPKEENPTQVSPKPDLYFEKLGKNFDGFMNNYDVSRRIALIFDQLLGGRSLKDASVLEVGCGTGRFSTEIARRGARLTVLDIGFGLVSDTSKRTHSLGTTGSACKLPFSDSSFDFVISSECIEHTPSPQESIREMARVCRPGGTLCLTTPNRIWFPVLLLSQWLGLRNFAGPERWIWPGDAVKILASNGFEEIRLSGCHLWPFQLSFTRPLLRFLDRTGHLLYPLMINFGVVAKRKCSDSTGM